MRHHLLIICSDMLDKFHYLVCQDESKEDLVQDSFGADYGSRLELADLNYTLFFPVLEKAELLSKQLEKHNNYILVKIY